MPAESFYTVEDVAQHSAKDDCWVIVQNGAAFARPPRAVSPWNCPVRLLENTGTNAQRARVGSPQTGIRRVCSCMRGAVTWGRGGVDRGYFLSESGNPGPQQLTSWPRLRRAQVCTT